MKINMHYFSRKLLLACVLLLSLTGFAQVNGAHFTIGLTNATNPTPTTMEFDVMITVDPTGVALADGGSLVAAMSIGVNFNPAILNGGTPSTALNGGSFALIPGTRATALQNLVYAQDGTYRGIFLGVGQLRIVGTQQNAGNSSTLAPGSYRVGRYRFTNTVAWATDSNANLWINPASTGGGATSTIVNAYKIGTTTPVFSYSTAAPAAAPGVTAAYTLASNLSVPLNPSPSEICATAGIASNLGAVTCFGGNNGSATITMSPVPTNLGVSYSVDGGAASTATLTAGGAFNVTGLSAGVHSIVVSNTFPGTICTSVSVPVTISGPSGPLTNTTTQSACGSYLWSVTNTTYTESGTYTGTTTNGSGCTVNETLNLTITPNTTTGSMSASACDTYTWAENNQTYTSSGTYTSVVGCNTATLTLTITPSTTTGSMSASACDTYTWAENNQTYTSSGTYTHVVGCNTATLTLTITPSTTNGSDTVTACGSYTWAANNQTYTASGVYTHTVGCNTATLNLTINTSSQTYYADTDGDGFGAGAPILSCTGQPEGTVTNNTDCAPADPLAWRTINLYVDADNDGYYNGNPETTAVCYGATVPSGYTATIIGTDCDDANPEANPNHVEIPANGIDDNCDGSTDETGPAIGMVPSQCGTTMSNVANTIYSQQAAGAQGYRFEVTNGSNVRTYDSATNSFSLLSLPGGVTYATTYSIRVAVKTNGFWRSYSAACSITTPAAPATTNVIAAQCGITLANIATVIYANQVTSANQYRFEVTDTATSNVRTYDTSLNRFSLTSLAGGASYGATYAIRVALRFGATWQDYGTSCNVSTPATPGITSLQSSQCGITISNRWTTLYATQVPDAQGYRFEITNGATVRFVDRATNNFALAQMTGGVAAGTVYTVRVAVLYNSVYGAFGPACNVTTAAVITRQAADAVAAFDVTTYPNPFADSFKLNISGAGEQNVSVKVYDMIGKLVESKEIGVSELGTQELGSRYSSGVYNVIVSQGENVETLRVIKR